MLKFHARSKVRISLGLKPLADTSKGETVEPSEEEVANANFEAQRQAASQERAAKDLKGRLDKARNQKELKARLAGKGLGEDGDAADAAADAKAWVKRTKKRAKEVAAELARKREAELEEMDQLASARYDERDLAGLKVGHDEDEFETGEDHVLTLKDSKLLDDEGMSSLAFVYSCSY